LEHKSLYGALLVILILIGVEMAMRADWLHGPEEVYYDLWHQVAGQQYQPQHVVIVAIDDQTLREHQDEPLVFWSPHFARAIQVLRQAGGRVIGLDYLFAVSPESWLRKLNLPESEKSRTFDLPFREQLAAGQVVLAGNLAADAPEPDRIRLPLPDYWGSLPGKLEDVGLVNLYNDPDGVIRRFVPVLPLEKGEAWVTFAQLLAERAGAKAAAAGQPLVRPIGFAGPPGTVPRVSFQRLLQAGAAQDLQVQGLKGKVVIIASEPSQLLDFHMTPYARSLLHFKARMMSGAEIHANIVETLLTSRFPRPVPPWVRALFLGAALALGTALFFSLSPSRGLAALLGLGLSLAGLAYLLFRNSWLIPVAYPQAGLALCYLGVLGMRLTREERERARLRQIFGKYVSDEVVEKLVASKKPPDLGGEALPVTVLFADIRNFTTLSEPLSPHEVVEILNAYFTRACEPILDEGGSVDKFIGDAIMAVFGSPVAHPDHARRAVRAAVALAAVARDFAAWVAERFPGRGLPAFGIGVGLHTGVAVVGNIGSPRRLEFTSIGDTVNTASRLEGLTKKLGWAIVASRETVAAAGPGVITGRREELRVKGRQEPVVVMEVTGWEAVSGGDGLT
jgi:adenylate cyclase